MANWNKINGLIEDGIIVSMQQNSYIKPGR